MLYSIQKYYFIVKDNYCTLIQTINNLNFNFKIYKLFKKIRV